MKTIYILWTGGWDSTYRMIELSRMDNIIIQPIYILDENRASKEYELKAIDEITEIINGMDKTKSKCLKVNIVNVNDLPVDKKISEAAQKMKRDYGWGVQHEWTALLATDYPGIEMCIEKVTKGYMPTREIIKDHGKIKLGEHGYEIDKDNSDELLKLVLGNIVLPIFETTEVQMVDNVNAWGYEDVMSHIWFCHNPIKGHSCGLCSPCHTKWDSDMRFLLTQDAKRRLAIIETLGKIFGEGSKIVGLYKRISRKIAE